MMRGGVNRGLNEAVLPGGDERLASVKSHFFGVAPQPALGEDSGHRVQRFHPPMHLDDAAKIVAELGVFPFPVGQGLELGPAPFGLGKGGQGLRIPHTAAPEVHTACAVAPFTAMAVNGATAHAVCHILYKALLFMGAGVAIQTTGKEKLTELGGFWRRQKLAFGLYMIGAFSI